MLFIKIDKHGIVKNIKKPDISFLKNIKNISHLNSWIYNQYEFKLFGSDIGNAGSENKYDLPPPVDSNLYFNNLYFIKKDVKKDDVFYDLTIDEYNSFYDLQFDGFQDILDEDDEITEELSEHTSDRDFIDDDDLEISSEDYEEEEAESSNSLELNISDISITDTEEDECEDTNISNNTMNSSLENNDLISSIEISISSSDNEDENSNNV
tara:strand:- start:814 stop:1443 length:630 start_codon:yes stop_codon:yes gene_type:complete